MSADDRRDGCLTWQIYVAANAVADTASEVSVLESDPALLQALLADHYRDARVAPLHPDLFALATRDLDEAHWLRFAVIVGMFAHEELRAVLPAVTQRMHVREQIEKGMVAPATALHAVDLRMLSSSMVRAEELARRVARGLGIAIEGEGTAESTARLVKIDYTRLLASVDKARASAQKEMDELQRMQEARDGRIERQHLGKP